MKIILIENLPNLGRIGDSLDVKRGFARNYLIPKKKAVHATENNIRKIKEYISELENKRIDNIANANIKAEKIRALGSITIPVKTNINGKLFGSVNNRNVANALADLGIYINKENIRLPHNILHNTGKYVAKCHIYDDIVVELLVNIVAV